MNRIAELCGDDPVTWRLRNLCDATPASRPATVTRAVAQASDFARKFAAFELLRRRREQFADLRRPTGGIGFGLGYQGSGFLGDHELRYRGSVTVRLETDGQASLRTSAVPGSRSVVLNWRSTIAEMLGLDLEAVRIEPPDTSLAPDSGPSTLSRNVAVMGRLIEQACTAIVKKRFRAPLPIEVTRSDRPSRGERWSAATLSGEPYRRLAYGAAVAEVVVDPVTFEPSVREVWVSVDAGKIIDEEEARRALEMGVHQALEWTIHEVVSYRDGAIDPRSYLAYRDEASRLVPSIQVVMIPSPMKLPAGLGELPQSCVPAAVAAAISQATGRYMDRLPANPSLIHGYLEAE